MKKIMAAIAHWRIFQKAATAILISFMGMMLFVAAFALTRPSGSTKQDMARAHIIRQEASLKMKESKELVER